MDVLPMCAWPARMVVAGCSSGSGYRSRCVPRFLGGWCRANTMLAAAYDLRVFFTVVAGRSPDQVRPAERLYVLFFIEHGTRRVHPDHRPPDRRAGDPAGPVSQP